MFGSTSSRSLNPMPHGRPGVASSINLPNSGWNTGAGSAFALNRLACVSVTSIVTLLCIYCLEIRNSSALLQKLFVARQRCQYIRLAEGQTDFAVGLIIANYQVFN